MELTASQIRAVIGHCQGKETFRECRKALNPAAREQGYYVNSGGATAKRMDAGIVAQAIRHVATILGAEWKAYPVATWCGKWPQTMAAGNAVYTGHAIVREYVEYVKNR